MFDLAHIPLFALADRRLAWIDRRQQLLSQNIANADTPGYRARDLKPFASLLAAPAIHLAATEGGALPAADGTAASGSVTQPQELAPDGNGVVLDKQLMNVAESDVAHELTTNLMQSYMTMFRTAIGR